MRTAFILLCLCSVLYADDIAPPSERELLKQKIDNDTQVKAARLDLKEKTEKRTDAEAKWKQLNAKYQSAKGDLETAHKKYDTLQSQERDARRLRTHVEDYTVRSGELEREIDRLNAIVNGFWSRTEVQDAKTAYEKFVVDEKDALRKVNEALAPFVGAQTAAAQKEEKQYARTFHMKDGSTIRVLSVVDADTTYAIKDEQGKFKTINKSDIEKEE